MARLFSVFAVLAALAARAVMADAPCNPTNATCPSIPGFTGDYSIDFTLASNIPSGWIVADYEDKYIHPGSNGLEFRLDSNNSAPYIWTSKYMHYGKVSVVLQSAPGIAVISSAVLFSDDMDEIDWEFSGNDFAQSKPTVQTNYYGKGITGNWDRGTQPQVASNMTKSFATYTLDWKPDSLTWSVNGTILRTLYAKDADNAAHQYPQTPARFHLGVWDAGAPEVPWYTKVWAGGDTDMSGFPYSMFVKSVSIQPYKYCDSYNYSDTSGSSSSVQCLNSTSPASGTGTASSVSSTTSTVSCPTPAPMTTQPGTPDGCAVYYKVKSGDDCGTIAKALNVSSSDIKTWNPEVGDQCYNLWLNYFVCGSPPGVCNGTTSVSSSSVSSTTQSSIASAQSTAVATSSTKSSVSSAPSSTASQSTSTVPVSPVPVASTSVTSTSTSHDTNSAMSTSTVSTTTKTSSSTTTSATSSPTAPTSPASSASTVSVSTKSTSSSSLSTSSAALPSSTTLSCPASNGTTYTTSIGANFTIECSVDHQAGDMAASTVSGAQSFQACIEKCATTTGCIDISLAGTSCYLKKTLGKALSNHGVWGARLSTVGTNSPIVPASVNGYSSLGCYSEKQPSGRALDLVHYDNQMTLELCALKAAGRAFFGVEYGRECWYGKTWPEASVKKLDQSACGFTCPGNASEYCGAGNAMQMYKRMTTARKRHVMSGGRKWFGKMGH